MRVRSAFQDREDTEVAVLDALADRHEDGMTVFELRSTVGADIDALEAALTGLQDSGLVTVEEDGDRTVFVVASSAIEADGEQAEDVGFLTWLKRRFVG